MHEFFHALEHALEHTLPEFLRLLPFLLLTYLLMEWLSRTAGAKTGKRLSRAGRLGPVLGGMLGAIPQCGFSAAAASLYAGRVVTVGTVVAVFLSTSDEMLPILISSRTEPGSILAILGVKMALGILFGLAVDLVWRRFTKKAPEPPAAEEENAEPSCACGCGCGGAESKKILALRIFLGALRHTATIAVYLFLIMLALDLVIHLVGEEALAEALGRSGFLAHVAAALVGLIPSCAASVAITELWVSGALSFGAMLSGLLVGAGVGLPVLFRSNRPMRENFLIVAILLFFGIAAGILFDLTGLSALIA